MNSVNVFFVNGSLKHTIFNEKDKLINALNSGPDNFKQFLVESWNETIQTMGEVITNPLQLNEENNFQIGYKAFDYGKLLVIKVPFANEEGDTDFIGIVFNEKKLYFFQSVRAIDTEDNTITNSLAEWLDDEELEIYDEINNLSYESFTEAVVSKVSEHINKQA